MELRDSGLIALNFGELLFMIIFLIQVRRLLRARQQKLDKLMRATLLCLFLSTLLGQVQSIFLLITDHSEPPVVKIMLTGWPPYTIEQMGIFIDVARLFLALVGLRVGPNVEKRRKMIMNLLWTGLIILIATAFTLQMLNLTLHYQNELDLDYDTLQYLI